MIEGRYYPPGSASSSPARFWGVSGDFRLLVEGDETVRHPQLLSVSDKIGNVPRKLTFSDGSVFEARPNADVDGFLNTHRSFFSRLSAIEGNWKMAAGAAVVTLALLLGLYRYGIPVLAAGAAKVTPSIIVEAMDAGTLQTVDRIFFAQTAQTETNRERVQRLFDELVAVSGHSQPPLRLLFRKGGKIGANAVALPGGTIIVTDELVELAKHDDEIAGVLAHEIGHVMGQHQLKQLYRVLGVSFMIGVIGGDSSQIVEEAVTQASALQSVAYTREFETDADRISVELMIKAGRNPIAIADMLDRITKAAGVENSSKKTGWLSTHPGTEDRRAFVTKLAREQGWKPN